MNTCPLEIDLESRSRVDLTQTGAHVYANHPSTKVLVARFAFGQDEDIGEWWPGTPCPPEIALHVRSGGEVRGWNVGFERQMWNAILGPQHGWPVPRLDQYSDNAALGAIMGLPRSLDGAASFLGLEEQKDDEGHRLMLQLSKPDQYGNFPYEHDFDKLQRLSAYCAQDVRTSRAVRRKLKPMTPFERRIWLLDQKINDRGVEIDMDLVDAMDDLVKKENVRLNGLMHAATDGAIEKTTQVVALAKWVNSQGVSCDSLAKDKIATLLGSDLPANIRSAIEIRSEASKSSTTKLIAARTATSTDRRARGMLMYHGASTGRWAGRLLQPHNMVRGSGLTNPDIACDLIKTLSYEEITYCYPWPLQTVADCMRGVMVAAKGKKLMAMDYSNIESRITAWFAGDRRKLQQFVKADRKEGPGMYELQAAGIYGVPVEEISHEDPRRQTGKTAELALGFGGGVAALAAMGVNYGIDMAEVYDSIVDASDTETVLKVFEKYETAKKRKNLGSLSQRGWIACELVKQGWRNANEATVKSWKAVDDAAWQAMNKPGQLIYAEGVNLAWQWEGGFLQLLLPSGRRLYYGNPQVREVEVPWSDKTVPKKERERKPAVTVAGVDSQTFQVVRYPLYPGLGIQHATQATARDILANGMLNAEAEGFPLVLTVHDEAIAEVDEARADLEAFMAALTRLAAWGAGIPLPAEGWVGHRYHKA